MSRSAAPSGWRRSGSQTTTSASAPTPSEPFAGQSPKACAGAVAAHPHPVGGADPPVAHRLPDEGEPRLDAREAAGDLREIARAPGSPVTPARRSARRNGQWSVPTVWIHPRARPSHRLVGVPAGRNGGVQTKSAASGPSSLVSSR